MNMARILHKRTVEITSWAWGSDGIRTIIDVCVNGYERAGSLTPFHKQHLKYNWQARHLDWFREVLNSDISI